MIAFINKLKLYDGFLFNIRFLFNQIQFFFNKYIRFFLIKVSYVSFLNLIYEENWFFWIIEIRTFFLFLLFWACFWDLLEEWNMLDYRTVIDENGFSEIDWIIWLNLILIINYISYARGFPEYLKKRWRISEILPLYRSIELANLVKEMVIWSSLRTISSMIST
jgi:hypothetical protein